MPTSTTVPPGIRTEEEDPSATSTTQKAAPAGPPMEGHRDVVDTAHTPTTTATVVTAISSALSRGFISSGDRG